MAQAQPTFFSRLSLAFATFWRIMSEPDYALKLAKKSRKRASKAQQPQPSKLETIRPDSALQLLALLQQEGRFIDFLREDVSTYSDQDIGAAARLVHQGCGRSLEGLMQIGPVNEEAEGSRVTVETGFDPSSIRLTGNVVGDPPFTGTLIHRGWRATDIRLPEIPPGRDLSIISAAEVEL